MAKRISRHILGIDPQKSFCDEDGALPVSGASEDMRRAATFIERVGAYIDAMHITLDTHYLLHIAHPIFWVDKDGNHPAPYTIISVEDVEQGRWKAWRKYAQARALEYVRTLRTNGRYALCIWNPHCLIGTPGHNIHENVRGTLLEWESKYCKMIDFVTKGSNMWTEHYSALKADVPDPTDPTTMLNKSFVELLYKGDIIYVFGEAVDYCVANTLKDIIAEFGKESAKKIVLLTDCMSAVNAPGHEHLAQEFFDEMDALGVTMMKSTDVIIGGK